MVFKVFNHVAFFFASADSLRYHAQGPTQENVIVAYTVQLLQAIKADDKPRLKRFTVDDGANCWRFNIVQASLV